MPETNSKKALKNTPRRHLIILLVNSRRPDSDMVWHSGSYSVTPAME